MRKIIHIDMDAFFAAVEQRDQPALRGRPVAVGGAGPRGVVMAASYEARRFGVRSAQPSFQARRLCPDLIIVPGRFDAYRAVSHTIGDIFHRYTPLVEPLSLDEAFLDVTAGHRSGHATGLARGIKADILFATGLTASAGVSFNKFLAKTASDLDKPDGLSVIRPDQAEAFLNALPIERFFGVGPATARRMKAFGIHSGGDLRNCPEDELVRQFGSMGRHYFKMARGMDDREVRPFRKAKSIGAERTFHADLADLAAMDAHLEALALKVAARLQANNMVARTVTLKIKGRDFTVMTRRTTSPRAVYAAEDLFAAARWLLRHPAPPAQAVRLLGVSVSNLIAAGPRQLAMCLESPPEPLAKAQDDGGWTPAIDHPSSSHNALAGRSIGTTWPSGQIRQRQRFADPADRISAKW